MTRRAIYLHGFASSPRSSKAAWFTRRASEAGMDAFVPDLNLPEFETLTISRMIAQVRNLIATLADGPVALVGSSLGALVALHAATGRPGPAAADRRPIDRLVFLAPAFDLVPGLEAHVGPAGIERWRTEGALEVFHYGDQRHRRLWWPFFEDARHYDASAGDLDVPVLIYQGARDEVVDPEMVRRWAQDRPAVTLQLLDDDHQLLGSLEHMWGGIREFLDLAR